MPIANYLWIGQPPELKNAGQDCIGPMLLKQKMPTQQVVVWCLAEFKSYYKDVYQGTGIEVCAVEDAILPEDSKLIEYMAMIDARINTLKEEGAISKDISRDYISLKDVLAYYLQTKHALYQDDDAYFIDTNVIPSAAIDIETLPELSQFSASYTEKQYDPWLMYRPRLIDESDIKAYKARFYKALEGSWGAYEILEEYGGKSLGSVPRHFLATKMMLGNAFVCNAKEAARLNCLYSDHDVRTLRDVPLQKRYMSSHKKSDYIDSTPLIARIVRADSASPDELRFYLERTAFDVKTIYSDYRRQQTNVFLAFDEQQSDKSAELEILLHYLDDISLLFFNDTEIDDSNSAPIVNFCRRHFDADIQSEQELPLLLRHCFNKYPLLESKCYQLINDQCDFKVSSVRCLLQLFAEADDEMLDKAFCSLLLTFKSIVPDGARRCIPESVLSLERSLCKSKSGSLEVGFFAKAQVPESLVEEALESPGKATYCRQLNIS